MSGNGADMGSIVSMLGHLVEAVDQVQRTQAEMLAQAKRERDETRREFVSVRQDIASVRQEVASMRQEVASVRQEVAGYHSSVMGHGILITELDARLRRVEDHLNLPPVSPH